MSHGEPEAVFMFSVPLAPKRAGSSLCKMAPREINTTSSSKSCANRRSLANLSMIQRQTAPTTTMTEHTDQN
jgi:hypothetical protein